MPAVPTQTFPQITSSTAPWIASGLHARRPRARRTGPTLCAKARNWIMNRWATQRDHERADQDQHDLHVHQRQQRRLPRPGQPRRSCPTAGSTSRQQSNWNGTAGTIKHIHFISVYSATLPGRRKDISVGNNTNFNTFTNVSFYTPCRATMMNTELVLRPGALEGRHDREQLQDDATSPCSCPASPASPASSRTSPTSTSERLATLPPPRR